MGAEVNGNIQPWLGRRILYTSAVDIGSPTGAGVNEREFIVAASKIFTQDLHLVIPEPTSEDQLPHSVTTHFVAETAPGDILGLTAFQWRQAARIRSLAKEVGFDLVVVRSSLFPLLLSQSLRQIEAPAVVKTLGWGVAARLGEHPGWSRRAAARLNRAAVRHLCDTALVVDTVTPRYISFLSRELRVRPEKFTVIDNGVNLERFAACDRASARAELGISESATVIGFCGAQLKDRGGVEAITAASRMRDAVRDLLVMIVGGTPAEIRDLKQFARAMGVEDLVRFEGLVPYERVGTFLACFDVGLAMERPIRLARTGHSQQKVRQYLACGVPVVAARGGDDFLERERLGSLVNHADTATLVEAVSGWLALDHEERDAFIERAREYTRLELSTDVLLRRRLRLWDDLLRGRRDPRTARRAGLV